MCGFVVLWEGGWIVDVTQGVPQGGVGDIGTLSDSFPQLVEEQLKLNGWGVMDHHMQDKGGRGDSNVG